MLHYTATHRLFSALRLDFKSRTLYSWDPGSPQGHQGSQPTGEEKLTRTQSWPFRYFKTEPDSMHCLMSRIFPYGPSLYMCFPYPYSPTFFLFHLPASSILLQALFLHYFNTSYIEFDGPLLSLKISNLSILNFL